MNYNNIYLKPVLITTNVNIDIYSDMFYFNGSYKHLFAILESFL